MQKVPDQVNLITFAPSNIEQPSADKPIVTRKTERLRRMDINPGEVQAWSDEQVPVNEKRKVRKRKCAFCLFSFRRLRTICPRCKNCQACGSYAGPTGGRKCEVCGNEDSHTDENIPTIMVN